MMRHTNTQGKTGLEVAVIGMAGRFPGAADLEEFWRNLEGGVESISFFSPDELRAEGVSPETLQDPSFVPAKGRLEGVAGFDAAFFGFSPLEARLTDPQHRLMLECAWQALEDAGYDPSRFEGLVGVYSGCGMNTYLEEVHAHLHELRGLDFHQVMIGNDKDHLSTRVSYKLGLEGPSLGVQTACSTSLVAVHLAAQALLNGECDMALAGGVTAGLPEKSGYRYREGMIHSPDGRCRAFDARGQGTVAGHGVGLVVLRRLEDALAAGDCIRAVIKGSAVNNDGSQKVGYTAPRIEGQARAIRAAQLMAEVDAESISYVEAHGTGTPLGDPIEVAALSRAFRAATDKKGFCALGSVKTNIGHLDAAAGIAGFIKAVLALQHRRIPPSLHFQSPNPEIDFDSSPFYVNTACREWASSPGRPRRAGVSSFGIGGTNAHVILEEAPPAERLEASKSERLLLLSARTPEALEEMTHLWAAHLAKSPELDLGDAAFTSQLGRQAMAWRRVVVASDCSQAAEALKSRRPRRVFTLKADGQNASAAFLFPGQGALYPGMGAEIYTAEPSFRRRLDECCSILQPLLGTDPLKALFQAGEAECLQQPGLLQPLLFAVEYSLAQLWMEWGVRPSAMIGHSLGEYAAACVAGVFSLEDALRLLIARGRLMEALPEGAMLGMPLSEEEAREILSEGLDLAAVNGSDRSVASGPAADIEALEEELRRRKLKCRRLETCLAFHSRMMAPVMEPFAAEVAKLRLSPPQIPYVSNLTGGWITAEQAQDPNYWASHLRHEVRFSDGMVQLLQQPCRVLLEVGPGQTLSSLARRQAGRRQGTVFLPSLLPPGVEVGEAAALYGALGRVWGAGIEVDWQAFSAHQRRRRVPLPTYPFQRQVYRLGPPRRNIPEARPESDGRGLAGMFDIPVWKQAPLPDWRDPAAVGPWLIFDDGCGFGQRIADELGRHGLQPTMVEADPAGNGDRLAVDPSRPEGYDALLDQLEKRGKLPSHWVHCWNVTDEDMADLSAEALKASQQRGFWSLIRLAQALGRRSLSASVRLTVVSSHIRRIAGEGKAAPHKATLLGPCRVIPKEYPGITCLSIDICRPAEGEAEERFLAEAVIQEALADPPALLSAYRGGARWLQTLEPLPIEAPADPLAQLRRDGAYLITGGLGAMGMAFAERFARQTRLRFALLSRSALPPRDQWPALLAKGDSASGSDGDLRELESLLAGQTEVQDIDSFGDFAPRLRALCASWAFACLAQGGLGPAGSQIGRNRLREGMGVLPKFQPFFEYMLDLLASRGLLSIDGERIRVLDGACELGDPLDLTRSLSEDYPQFEGLVSLLAHCGRSTPQALRGEVEAISILYPEGERRLLEGFAERTARHGRKSLYCEMAAEVVARRAEAAPGSTLKILEVGGGNGSLTRTVIGRLRSRNVEYHFTDLGKSFVHWAEQRAARESIGFMRFATLDISQSALSQGFTEGGFDVVLALDVVHATPNAAATVANLKELLAPGGALLIIEAVRPEPWLNLIWGLAEGWWYFDDGWRQKHPLLAIDRWQRLLEESGFAAVDCLPCDEEGRKRSDYALLTARAELEEAGGDRQQRRLRHQIRQLRQIEALGSRVELIRADVSNFEELQAALGEARRRLGPLRGVIHAAGVLGGGVIQLKERQAAQEVLAPKLLGTLHLERLLRDEPLDFFLLCSSTSALSGAPGQADYCAANAFLDAFAHWDARRIATSINWDRWQQIGMAAEAAAGRQEAHPLLGKRLFQGAAPGTLQRTVFGSRLSPQSTWVLDEHRLLDRPVLPGTAFLEMARAAFQEVTGRLAVEMRDVHFWTPLIVPPDEPVETFTILDRHPQGFGFQVLSADSAEEPPFGLKSHFWGLAPLDPSHPSSPLEGRYLGRVAGVERSEPPENAPVRVLASNRPSGPRGRRLRRHVSGALQELSAQPPDHAPLQRRIHALRDAPQAEVPSNRFGPRWQTLQRHQAQGAESLALIDLAEEFRDDLEVYRLHPSLLDMATGIAFAAADLEGFYLPLSYGRLRLWAPLNGPLQVYAQRRKSEAANGGVSSVDVVIADQEGQVLAEVERFTKRRVDIARGEKRLASSGSLDEDAATLGTEEFPEIPPAGWGNRPLPEEERGLRPRQAVEALCRILSRRRMPQVVVSARRLDRRPAEPQAAQQPTIDAQSAAAAPDFSSRGEPQATLSRLFCEVLGLDDISLDDNFFEQGGDSILGLQVVARAAQAGLRLTPEQIFEHQSIAALAQALSEEGAAPDQASPPTAPEPPAEAPPAPSDFPLANLDQSRLEKLMRTVELIDQANEGEKG